MKVRILEAEFIAGHRDGLALPGGDLPEIAITGRSNAGKSTFINRLVRRTGLARTSSTPGHTREFNLFHVRLEIAGVQHALRLIDMPGFGFAKFSKSEREALSRAMVEFVVHRPALRLLCLLNDSRRLPMEDELAIRRSAFDAGRQVLVVLTKLDQLNQSGKVRQIRAITEAYGLAPEDVLLSSDELDPGLAWARFLPALAE